MPTEVKKPGGKKRTITSPAREYPQSFRLDYEAFNILNQLHRRAAILIGRKVSISRLINALIYIGNETEDKKLSNAIKKALIYVGNEGGGEK